jgi:hypothetical protein
MEWTQKRRRVKELRGMEENLRQKEERKRKVEKNLCGASDEGSGPRLREKKLHQVLVREWTLCQSGAHTRIGPQRGVA